MEATEAKGAIAQHLSKLGFCVPYCVPFAATDALTPQVFPACNLVGRRLDKRRERQLLVQRQRSMKENLFQSVSGTVTRCITCSRQISS